MQNQAQEEIFSIIDKKISHNVDKYLAWQEWKHFLRCQGQLLRKECSIEEFAEEVYKADYKYAKPTQYFFHKEQLETA